jgi:hypothetical protein
MRPFDLPMDKQRPEIQKREERLGHSVTCGPSQACREFANTREQIHFPTDMQWNESVDLAGQSGHSGG